MYCYMNQHQAGAARNGGTMYLELLRAQVLPPMLQILQSVLRFCLLVLVAQILLDMPDLGAVGRRGGDRGDSGVPTVRSIATQVSVE